MSYDAAKLITEIIARHPAAERPFLTYKIGCAGCPCHGFVAVSLHKRASAEAHRERLPDRVIIDMPKLVPFVREMLQGTDFVRDEGDDVVIVIGAGH